ncbi:hypothetical protein PybrP1_001416 [[Pythium] brassicae (nom. inval.)]|nr:hypothetical protein PybrP1_001416 [[Pythium] brassicae (nom. inval.)]
MTRSVFNELPRRFAKLYHIPNSRERGGRPPKFRRHHQALGMPLRFYVSSDDQSSLCLVFGAPQSIVSHALRRAEHAMERALAGFYPFRISWPSEKRQIELIWQVEAREPLFKCTFGFIDDKNNLLNRTSRTPCIMVGSTVSWSLARSASPLTAASSEPSTAAQAPGMMQTRRRGSETSCLISGCVRTNATASSRTLRFPVPRT